MQHEQKNSNQSRRLSRTPECMFSHRLSSLWSRFCRLWWFFYSGCSNTSILCVLFLVNILEGFETIQLLFCISSSVCVALLARESAAFLSVSSFLFVMKSDVQSRGISWFESVVISAIFCQYIKTFGVFQCYFSIVYILIVFNNVQWVRKVFRPP